MSPIEEAILRTVIYADIFNFPLTRPELQHYLISSQPVSLAQIEQTLDSSPLLQTELDIQPEYVAYARGQGSIAVRGQRAAASLSLWPLALHYGQWLARLPFVRMVALTGALAVRNASDDDDDLDYVLVTAAGRVWLARAFAIVLVRLAELRGVVVCPNYVLAETALEQPKRDLFMAHEVAQMVPIYGLSLYRAMRACNPWVEDYLPNASDAFYVEQERLPGSGWDRLKRVIEWALGGRIGAALEGWEYRRKLRRFAGELRAPHSAALLDDQHVKGHFNDHGYPVLRQYEDRLRRYDLDALPLAAD
ncbi:MAG TPA: hypothetical protein VHD90_03135 [Phototrophicaceae bacterium]|nr:hypothetical protein [Phototrophicaceae bacterium]